MEGLNEKFYLLSSERFPKHHFYILDRFYAVFEGDNQDDLKSYQQGCVEEGHGIHNKWSGHDTINVIGIAMKNNQIKDNSFGKATYTKGSDSLAVFNGNISFKLGNNETAYLFAAHNGSFNYNMGGYKQEMNYSINENQTYNGKIENEMPMIARASFAKEGNGKNKNYIPPLEFKFYNLASLIRFDVTPCDCECKKKLKEVKVTSKGNIAGEGTAYFEDASTKTLVNTFNGNGKTITLNCVSADTIQGILSYVMVVPPVQDAELTFKITVETDENGTKNQETHTLGTKTLSFTQSKYKTVAIDLKKY